MAFPTSPTDGQIYNEYRYNSTLSVWEKAIQIDSNGYALESPLKPMFMAHGSGSHQTNSSAEIMIFNTALTNIGNGYDTSTNRFTAPIAGIYRFSQSWMTYNGAHERAQFKKNGVYVGDQNFAESVSGVYTRGAYEIIIGMAQGDYMEVWRNVNSETETAVHTSYRHFSGEILGQI